jgi:hypothetical protein
VGITDVGDPSLYRLNGILEGLLTSMDEEPWLQSLHTKHVELLTLTAAPMYTLQSSPNSTYGSSSNTVLPSTLGNDARSFPIRLAEGPGQPALLILWAPVCARLRLPDSGTTSKLREPVSPVKRLVHRQNLVGISRVRQ